MATPCTACHKDVYGPRTMHSACERAGSTRFAPVPAAAPRMSISYGSTVVATVPGPAAKPAPSTRHKATPPVPAPKVAPKRPRRSGGLLDTLRAMGCVQCPTCHHYMAPEHPATCQGDVLMLGYGDMEGFTSKLTSAQQLDNEARRLAHAIADRKGEVAA